MPKAEWQPNPLCAQAAQGGTGQRQITGPAQDAGLGPALLTPPSMTR